MAERRPQRRPVRATSAWTTLLCSAALSATPGAAVADEREWVVVAEPTFGVYRGPIDGEDTAAVGGGGALAGWIGLTPAAWLFASAGVAAHSDGAPVIGEAVGGVVLALDVLRAIPFLDLGIGGTLVDAEPVPVLRVGLGLDYLVTPRAFVGLVARYRPSFGRGGEDWWTISLRLGWRDEL